MVLIRSVEEKDVESLALLLNSESVSRYLTSKIPYPYTLDDAKWFVSTGSKDGINKAIEFQGEFVGMVGVSPGEFENDRSAEIGYWVGEPYWGKGIATNALGKMTEFIFKSTEIVRLFAPVFSPNDASKRVLDKCGYYQESIQKMALHKNGAQFDAYIYAKLHA